MLREAARGLVPDRIIDKPKIGFFNASASAWIAQAVERGSPELLLPATPRYGEFIDRAAVEQLLERQRSAPTPRRAQLLLAIVLLETWLETYLPRALAPPEQERRPAVATG